MYYYCIIYDVHATGGSGEGQTGESDIVGIVLIAASHGWCSTPYINYPKNSFLYFFFHYTVLYVRKPAAYLPIYVFLLQNFELNHVTIFFNFV